MNKAEHEVMNFRICMMLIQTMLQMKRKLQRILQVVFYKILISLNGRKTGEDCSFPFPIYH